MKIVTAAEEAIVASVVRATTLSGHDGHVREAVDIARLKAALKLQ